MESIEEALQNSVTAAEKQIEDFKIKFIKNYEIVFIKYFLKHLEEIFFVCDEICNFETMSYEQLEYEYSF
ncbi:hypothetical protein GVAV_003599 [Gurleya vavrai]